LGGFDIVHVTDERGQGFATRIGNIFIIGKGKKPWITLPRLNGLYLSPVDARLEAEKKRQRKESKETKVRTIKHNNLIYLYP